MNLMNKLLIRTAWKRATFFLSFDILLIALAMYGAFVLRFEGRIPSHYLEDLPLLILVALAIKIPIFSWQRLYQISWAYASIEELLAVVLGTSYSLLLMGTLFFILRDAPVPGLTGFPRSILAIDYFLTLVLIGGFRFAKRIYLRFRFFNKHLPETGERTLIVGAGDAGEQIARNIRNDRSLNYLPVGFVDDNPAKHRTSIHGFQVLGGRENIPQLVEEHRVENVLIAMPSATSRVIRETVELARGAGVEKIRILPGLSELILGEVGLADLREIQVEDLLGRDSIEIDTQEIESYLKGRSILVTGAGGSIGTELCRQVLSFAPAHLVLLDQDESALFMIDQQLVERYPKLGCTAVIGDIKDRRKIREVFRAHRPQVVFHAAAYKHVPVMERHPDEAVKNNVLGTRIVAEATAEFGAEKFVLISTDKAVNPTSVMGASKRVAEMVITALNERETTQFIAVRFGNVLGSRGSVVPIFQGQIRHGGPVTVTHPEMERYFMVTSEAVLLVLQAGAMGQGGEVYVLDMGELVKIVDLARELIRFSGLEPDEDIPIVFTGPRPGERLYESILTAEENKIATQNEKIFIARIAAPSESLFIDLDRLQRLVEAGENDRILELLQDLVPDYRLAGLDVGKTDTIK